ncbi:MAG: alpha/beta hydrolase domain-containing protein [Actinomycetota bacterium]
MSQHKWPAFVFAVALCGISSCSSSSSSGPASADPATVASTSAATDAPTTTVARPTFKPDAVGAATVAGPITSGKGAIVMGVGGLDLASVGYTQEEFFLSGTADSYSSATPLSSDGKWTIAKGTPAPFTTRIVVRRPVDPAKFNGSVAVEWLNVTAGFDSAPDWSFSHAELIRAGWTWVGVSAQSVGIVGGGNALGAALALKAADPDRYAPLSHPGDSYSYDMFSQAGAVVRTQASKVLGGLTPKNVIAFGESQSAFRLNTYVNAIAPIANVFDGFLIHSRGAVGAALSQKPLADIAAPDPTLIRTDLGVPVLNFLSETDMLGDRLGYGRAEQPDTDFVRAWEVPGTAHADVYSLGIGDTDDGSGAGDAALFAALQAPNSSIYGGVITCDLGINAGPHTYVLRSAISALNAWVSQGTLPPTMPRITLNADKSSVVLDPAGNAKGGIRMPHVDVPLAKLSGFGQTGTSFCGLFGTTVPFDAAQLAAAYPDHATFVSKWNAAVDSAVASGALLAADAKQLKAVAEASTIGNPG